MKVQHDLASRSSGSAIQLIHRIASLYYEDDLSQSQIGQKLGISAATVSRHLRMARELGVVQISVHKPVADDSLARELADTLGLRHVELAEDTSSKQTAAHLAVPLGRALEQLPLTDGSYVAVGWGQTLWDISGVGLPELPNVTFTPASGGIASAEEPFQTNEIVRRMALSAGARLEVMHAPYLPSLSLRKSLATDTEVSRVTTAWDRLSAAIVGIGLPHHEQLKDPHLAGRVTPDEQDLEPAAGDVLLHYLADTGSHIPWSREDHLLGLSHDQLLSTRNVIGVATGTRKVRGIIAAARAGIVSMLVTDQGTARAILQSL